MAKERRTVSLEPEVDAYLGRSGVNASELVNSLVKREMNGGFDDDTLREWRMQQAREEYEDLASRAKRKLETFNRLRELENKEQDERETVLREAIDELVGVEADPTNPAMKNWADKAGMRPEDFVEELEDRRGR